MKKAMVLFGALALGLLLLALAVGLGLAQGPTEAEVQPRGEVGMAAPVAGLIPIQGRLTDSSGNPLNGNYTIRLSLYDVASGGTAKCSSTQPVTVTNGLFNTYIANCTSAVLNGQQLFLGIRVGSDPEMTPRQPIYPVPYAWSLIPGAVISDTRTSAVLNAFNHGNGWGVDAYSKGHDAVHGRSDASNHAAVSGENTGGGIGVYGASGGIAIKAAGSGIIQSTAPTDWVVSPLKMVQEESVNGNDLNIIPSTQFGYVKLYTDGKDDCKAILPVDVVAYLFGTRVKLSSFESVEKVGY